MSRRSSESANRPSTPSRRPESTDGSPIILVDHTKTRDFAFDEPIPESSEDEAPAPISPTRSPEALSQKWTHNSLREELAKRKWAKYQEARLSGSRHVKTESFGSVLENSPTVPDPEAGESSDRWGESTFSRGRRKAREVKDAALGRKATITEKTEADSVVDVMYENQRGAFFFGIPLFSSRSLLNLDPSPWLDGHFKPSAVDITNAQVPDPSWEWDWRTWYVDMSRDVDEEGWEYSFSFQKNFSWHGTHPWFHSFVRRRRWLRRRIRRKHRSAADKAHAMNPDYFTIHTSRAKSPVSSLGTSSKRSHSARRPGSTWGARSWMDPEEELVIQDVPALMKALRQASIDREKIVHLKTFLENGGDELVYLAEQIPTIMSLLVFQNSRRQLLSLLMRKISEVDAHRAEHEKHGQEEDETEKHYVDNLLSAVNVASEECKNLEFWSDMQDVERVGDALGLAHHDGTWGHTFPVSETSNDDYFAAESGDDAFETPMEGRDKGKAKATSPRMSPTSPGSPASWIDGISEQQPKYHLEDILSDEDERPGRLTEDEEEEEDGDAQEDVEVEPEHVKSIEELKEEIMPQESPHAEIPGS